jgi:peroxiredoxin (alkyl hydroperoxide reductase subunit C)
MITTGDAAPDIDANAYFPKDDKVDGVRLKDSRGKWVVLTFYPGDFTFVCATDIEALMVKYADFLKNGAVLYAISTDSVYSHRAWAQTSPRVQKSAIPMIEDIKRSISASYGFLNERTGTAKRSVVIIDPDGLVQYLSVSNDLLGKDAEHIYNAFMGLKHIYNNKAEKGKIFAIPAGWKPGDKPIRADVVKDIGKY